METAPQETTAPGWPEHLLALASEVAKARIGGAFWGRRPDLGGYRMVLSLCHPGANPGTLGPCEGGEGRTLIVTRRRIPGLSLRMGAHCLHDVDPHPVVDAVEAGCISLAVPVAAWWLDDLGLAAALRGVAFIHPGPVDDAETRRLHAAAFIASGTAYRDPFHGTACGVETAVALVRSWRDMTERNRDVAVCAGMSLWKRQRIAQFFHDGRHPTRFRRSAAAAIAVARRRQGSVAVWSSRMPDGLTDQAASAAVPVLRVEDGFVRSLGLGADLLPPCSIIADATGLYLDPRGPSDLETLLARTDFDALLLARAARLMALLRQHRISKYGASGAASVGPELPQDRRRRILVPGQVADDLSVRLGSPGIADNLGLLVRTRADHPDAWIVYRPHPDVDAGHRPGAVSDAVLLEHADAVSRGGSILDLIEAMDEIHTLTSLAGFEALLRGKTVVVHGQPFYAGWGLTIDKAPSISRRGRRLSVEALAAAALLLYPRYIDPRTGLPCGPELLIERLGEPELWRASWLTRLRRVQGRIRRGLAAGQGGGNNARKGDTLKIAGGRGA